jgi:5-methylcytosine-specific restriction protein A
VDFPQRILYLLALQHSGKAAYDARHLHHPHDSWSGVPSGLGCRKLGDTMHPFQLGREYPRSELLSFIGSKQQQAGVLCGGGSPGCIIVTSGGRHGAKVGYSDEALPDGSWWYFGQGRSGDHMPGNPANRRLAEGLQTVLLFTTREPTAAEVRQRGNYQKLFRFQGMFNVCGHETVSPAEGTRNGDKLLRFLLVPASGEVPAIVPGDAGLFTLIALRKQLAEAVEPILAPSRLTVAQYRQRSGLVKRYALLRAAGKCEACGSVPPFVDDAGNGFLEVHHICRLADEGIDAPENVAAVCPNCHRRAHHSADRLAFQRRLAATVWAIEQASDTGLVN